MTTTLPDRSTTCVACHDRSPSTGWVCAGCLDTLTAPAGFLPRQISSAFERGSEDVLVDRWGHVHPLSTSTVIGRAPVGPGITILDASIARAHARLCRVQGVWRLRDLGSSTGTFVNRAAITECEVRSGDRLGFGAIGFILVLGRAAPTPRRSALGEIERVRTRLSPCQRELVELLARRMLAEQDQPAPVRGFVRSSELLGTLSWDTSTPVDSHIKQLVRRVRKRLVELGLGDMIEARHGFGYRLRPEPEAESARR